MMINTIKEAEEETEGIALKELAHKRAVPPHFGDALP
jgi:hypothetical protein